ALETDDVVLEVGGGEGVLTERLLEAAAHIHLIEIDEGLREHLVPIAERSDALEITWADAMRADLRALAPAPTAMVANLPYSIATPLILRTIAELPSLTRWTVMVQREIAERLRARPGSKTYGSPSVTVQLSCEVRMLRRVDPAVFKPRPRVDSAVLALRRRGPGLQPRIAELIRDCFAHRRKTIPRSLELSARRRETAALEAGRPVPRPRPAEIRHEARQILRRLGMPEDARAEMLTPDQHRALAEGLAT
ncbi:MAG TPA: 16S rRNA (adenine(1518)-N(6)/adenine(1519)-N(6))-dimethyltransferase RsmA, partial [Solirubrobacterales bacterium]|nr:16S rRNA (adenine(1518)-N(6)/adenine(1519)-N(6))-dimethyltransferase RsmA [Solirubrobacterales bacterium]